jgi:formylmethanofuran dehydrogenase subunit C
VTGGHVDVDAKLGSGQMMKNGVVELDDDVGLAVGRVVGPGAVRV